MLFTQDLYTETLRPRELPCTRTNGNALGENNLSGSGTTSFHEGSLPKNKAGAPAQFISDNLPVLVLAEPFSLPKAGGGEARESTTIMPPLTDSRGGQFISPKAAPVCTGGKGLVESGLQQKDICENRHQGNPFSVQANHKPNKEAQQARIVEALRAVQPTSCEALEGATGLSHQSCSARISELKREGKIVICGEGKTRSGSGCAVYELSPNGATPRTKGQQHRETGDTWREK